MKLYLFQCGTIRTKKHLLTGGPVTDELFEVPVPFFLIVHPRGNVLFDTGQPLSAIAEAATGDYIPVMTDADYVAMQLGKVGLNPGDISHIVLSHRHGDHAGGLEAFRDAECFLQAAELNYGDGQNFIARYPLRWRLLNGDHDVFDDGGLVKIVLTPGHTPGHQSLLLKLDRWGDVLLAADSVYLDEILDCEVIPGENSRHGDTSETIGRIRRMRRDGVRIIAGHDPVEWQKLKKAPEYYQ